MTKQHERTQHMTTRPVSAVSYFLPEDSYLPGMIRPHTYAGWHAYWKAEAPNGQSMTAIVAGPYESREDALAALYRPVDEILAHKEAVKAAYDAR